MCRGRAWLNLSVGWFFYPHGSHLSPLGCLWAVWSLLISPAAITNRNNSQTTPPWRHLTSVPINKTFQRAHRRADCICFPRCALASPPPLFLRHRAATVLSASYEWMQSGFITISPWRNAWCTREQTTLCFLFWSLRPPGCSHRQVFFLWIRLVIGANWAACRCYRLLVGRRI